MLPHPEPTRYRRSVWSPLAKHTARMEVAADGHLCGDAQRANTWRKLLASISGGPKSAFCSCHVEAQRSIVTPAYALRHAAKRASAFDQIPLGCLFRAERAIQTAPSNVSTSTFVMPCRRPSSRALVFSEHTVSERWFTFTERRAVSRSSGLQSQDSLCGELSHVDAGVRLICVMGPPSPCGYPNMPRARSVAALRIGTTLLALSCESAAARRQRRTQFL